jgi:transcriptional regulator with XRE-family HTH domain/KaiC/GvpD/RAD55 family RecA-like ATPase
MTTERLRVASGVNQLDRLLDGLYIGDNVVWYDDAGSLAAPFCLNFIQASQSQKKPLIYVCFDRSPRNLLEKLGRLADYPLLTILDCFTYGKGAGSRIFLDFYNMKNYGLACRIIPVTDPRNMQNVSDSFYGIHEKLEGDVRFVFESITGMQELWNGEEYIINFYSHSCPRLYELNTIAYWIIEKKAHTQKLRAQINQIAQVAIDLSVKRGKTALTVIKAEKRTLDTLNKPYIYWTKDPGIISFEFDKKAKSGIDIGMRIKELRTRYGLSQTKLAKLVGVTPSNISQVESNLIFPSLPALMKIAEVLSVDVSSFFSEDRNSSNKVVFPFSGAIDVQFPYLPKGSISGKMLTPVDFEPRAESFVIEFPPGKKIPTHFFVHKGEEFGYLIKGKLQMKINKTVRLLNSGDVVYLTSELPSEWKNTGTDTAKLLWIKINQ